MELTIDQALQKAIEAHRAGQVQEADRFYTAILKVQPKHPDANHNLGVLAVSVGKVEEALPLLKTALETNPSIAQFWLSYIDALTKLNKFAEAKAVLDQATNKGAEGESFDMLAQRLQEHSSDTANVQTLETELHSTFDLAMQLREDGKFIQAINILKKDINRLPEDADILALLSHCCLLAEQLDEAKRYLDKAKEIAPGNASVGWNTARLMLKEKKPVEALSVARRVSKEFPDDVEGMGVLGACLRTNEEFTESLEVLNRAINLNPDYAEALINRGLIRLSQENKTEALSDFEKAYRLKPHIKQIWDLVVGLKMEAQKYSDAILLLNNMIAIDPENDMRLSTLALCHQHLKDFRASEEAYKKVIALKPDYAEAYNNMGVTLQEQGKQKEAILAYSKALSLKPDYVDVYYNMGAALQNVRFRKANQQLENAIIAILDRETIVRPSAISRTALSLIKCQPEFKGLLSSTVSLKSLHVFEEVSEQLSRIPLLLKLMSVCPLPDLDFERMLSELRSFIVRNIADIKVGSSLLMFQSALALQCFINEYVYDFNESDAEALSDLEQVVSSILANGSQPEPHLILCLASFKALHMYEWSDQLKCNDDLEVVIRRQITEPKEERALKLNIGVLGEINDKVSSKVRDQYEQNPYPRWVNLGLRFKSASISQVTQEIKLKLSNEKILSVTSPDVLIAGCGTGQHSIAAANRFNNSKVLAIDLSLSSLAYAKRKTQELGIQNIEYMQSDILCLRDLNHQFDIIECAGVLHHMNDPIAGWEVLADCLRPGGLMRIGLYSEMARKHVVDYRNRIAEAGLVTSEDSIRSIRTSIARCDDDSSKIICSVLDYFSMSEMRDLLFHVQEHRFTIPQIEENLMKLGLEFCGFEANHIVAAFKELNPTKGAEYDLYEWHTFEQDNPRAFAGMYQFWCQKIV